jgi:multidrug efflux pump subunit AcrB
VIYFVGRNLGREIFPIVDAGQFELRLRAPAGTRLEQTEALAKQTLDVIAKEAGAGNVSLSLGYVGVQAGAYPVNVIHLWTSGSEEAVLQVQLKSGALRVEELKERLRNKLPQALPGVRFSFEPSDIVSRVMSFGAPTPIQVAISGPDFKADREFTSKVQASLAKIPSLRDLAIEQELDYPAVRVNFDRERAGAIGVTADQAARSLADATGSSRYTTANFWADPKSGVGYQIQVQVPIERMNSLEEIRNIPVSAHDGSLVSLRQVADVSDSTILGQYDRYNMQRMLTLGANVAGEDLGRTAGRIERAIADAGAPPPRVNVSVRGQIAPMRELFGGLTNGLGMAVLVIFLLLAANFQSLRLSLAIILTVPAVVAGVVIALWLTHTTLNIQSFMGAIMAVGVAVANAILLITFVERNRVQGVPVARAAVDGAASRLRPILMTSCAMIAGMIPMAIGAGEGGEQTAPLGRAVIGGLVAATLATLVVLPVLFTLLQRDRTRRSASIHPEDDSSESGESRVEAAATTGDNGYPQASSPTELSKS